MEPPEWGGKMCWLGNSFDPVFQLRKSRDGRARFSKERKKTFSLRSISMMAKQFVVMEEMDERSL